MEDCRENGLLAAFLDIAANEFFCILLEDVVDLVENGVDVLGHLLVPLGDLGVDRGLDLVGLLARAGGALLPAGVPGGHESSPGARTVRTAAETTRRYRHPAVSRGRAEPPEQGRAD